jgi:hypothetical protein
MHAVGTTAWMHLQRFFIMHPKTAFKIFSSCRTSLNLFCKKSFLCPGYRPAAGIAH